MRLCLTALTLVGLTAATAASAAERSFAVTGFDKVSAAGSEDVVITTGKTASVVATGPQERLDKLEISVDGGTLKIRQKSGSSWSWGSKEGVVIRVSMPTLHAVSTAGSGDVTADGGAGPDFVASIAGSGDMRISNVNSASVRLSTAGSGDFFVAGKCTTLKTSISGSGDMNLAGLTCADADVGISGSGDVMVHASRTANVRISGSGDVKVTGGSKCTSRTSGSGDVSCG
jgi:hypothetical protein